MKFKRIISLLAAVTLIHGETAFAAESRVFKDFEYADLTGTTVEIKLYRGDIADVDIPDRICGKAVTYIGKNSFKTNNYVSSVKIPNGVTAIGKWAFLGCKKLTEVSLPKSLSSVGGFAFAGCESLQTVILPDHVCSIGEGAFSDCLTLSRVLIPESVTSIEENAFYGCPQVTIFCLPDTAAERYAISNGIPYKLLDVVGISGDVNSDGEVTSSDSLSVLRASIGLGVSLTFTEKRLADVDEDGSVTSADSLAILRSSVSLPVNERIGRRIV